jgi:hypothetical protein
MYCIFASKLLRKIESCWRDKMIYLAFKAANLINRTQSILFQLFGNGMFLLVVVLFSGYFFYRVQIVSAVELLHLVPGGGAGGHEAHVGGHATRGQETAHARRLK